MLNLFYGEPDPDRWLRFDRYPRKLVRRIVRGAARIGGHRRVFINLCAGLDRLGLRYRVNDYRYVRSHPKEVACVLGKPHLLHSVEWRNPIVFGPAVFSHPLADPDLFSRHPIKLVLVPGEWVRSMFQPYYGNRVVSWPVGIDTATWSPVDDRPKDIDFIVYNKVHWDYDEYDRRLLGPIRSELRRRNLNFVELRYGHYSEAAYLALLRRSRAMITVGEHETQGIAYLQGLSCDVPILAWDRGGLWRDPEFFPRVQFGPVTSVPYWDERCGEKFVGAGDFPERLDEFRQNLSAARYAPRAYVVQNLTLETCAHRYAAIVAEVSHSLA